MSSPDLTDHTVALATRQDGVVAVWQLVELGFGPAAVERWVRDRRLLRVHRGVYALGHRALSTRGRLRAALLALGVGSRLSHRTLAAWLGLSQHGPARPDVTIARRSGHAQPGITVHRVRRLDAVDLAEHGGLPGTTVARCLLDLAEVAPVGDVRQAVREAAIRGVLDLPAVDDVLERAVGRRGRRPLRLVMASHRPAEAGAESHPEARFLRFCAEHGLPEPEVQAWVRARSGRRYRVDALWSRARLVVEVDGWTVHRTAQAFEEDRRKDDDLRDSGFDVRRVTAKRLRDDPHVLAERLHRALTASWVEVSSDVRGELDPGARGPGRAPR